MLKEEYTKIKSFLNNKTNSKINHSNINMSFMLSIMYDWLETYEYSKDFEALMHTIKDDYIFNGTMYRGLTLLKESNKSNESSIAEHLIMTKPQSFTKNIEVATNFAKNNMVTTGDEINIIKKNNEVKHVIITSNCSVKGIDLEQFAKDLIFICRATIEDKNTLDEYEELLSYALNEQEVLVLPHEFRENLQDFHIEGI